MNKAGLICLGELLELVREPVDPEPTARYLPIGVRSFGNGIFHYDPVDGAELGKLRWFSVRPGELVVSNIKGWEGAIAVSSEKEVGCIASNRFLTYRPIDDRADVRYLCHYFLSEPGLELLRRASPGSTDRNLTLGIQAFESIEIRLPSIDVQRRIAERLDTAREGAARLQKLRDKTDMLASALPAAIAQRLDLSDHQKRASGWKRSPLRASMHLAVDAHPVEPACSYPNIGILNFGRGLFEKPPIDGAHTSARTLSRVRAGQFIYSRLFAFEGAYAAVPPRYDSYYVSNEFPTFDLDPGLDANFLAAYFRSPTVWDELRSSARGLGVRRQRIHPDTLLDLEVWLPPVSTQELAVYQLQRLQDYRVTRDRTSELIAAFASSAINEMFGKVT
jgi:type I restriction enzyme, S subunit